MKSLSLIFSFFISGLSFTVNAGTFVLSEYNVVTIGDFQSTSHVDGKAFVGGDLTGSQNVAVGAHLPQNTGENVLTVVGKVKTDVSVYNNNLEVSESSTVTANNQNFIVDTGFVSNTKSVVQTPDAALNALRADYKQQLENASTGFTSLASNNDVTFSDNKKHTFNANNVDDNGFAVFSIDGENGIFTSNDNQEFWLLADNLSDIAGIIINVSGTNIDLSGVDMSHGLFGDEEARKKVVWNFYGSDGVDNGSEQLLLAKQFNGTLLAPYATVNTTGNIDGNAGVFSLITNSEIHKFDTKVTPLSTITKVPEPSMNLLFLLMFMSLYVSRKYFKV